MINISDHLNRIDAETFLDSLSILMWDYLNPIRKRDKKYKVKSLIHKIDSYYLHEVRTDKYLKEVAEGSRAKRKRHKKFFKYLRDNNHKNLRLLIISKPQELEAMKADILDILEEKDYNSGTVDSPEETKFGELLTGQIFNYSAFRKSKFCRDLISSMDLNHATCPYCNYSFVDVVDISEEKSAQRITKAYLDLDHFMPKSQNPFFALSFYNLIPSCHSCNATEKRSKPFLPSTHINPFQKDFNSIYTFKLHEDYLTNPSIENPVSLVLNNGFNDETAEALGIDTRYKNGAYQEALDKVDDYWNYRHHAEIDESKDLFKTMVTQNMAVRSSNILKYPRGKLERDLILSIDAYEILED